MSILRECEDDYHFFDTEEPVTNTPEDRRCTCGLYTWGDMDKKLLETWWRTSWRSP